MTNNFKNIHIGKLIKQLMKEYDIDTERAATFLKVSEDEIEMMYIQNSLECEVLLRWSKLLKYDFFRIYSQHLILYSPQDCNISKRTNKKSKLPVFKKNIYTQEVINYLVELVDNGTKTCKQIQEEYNIPATTVFRWRDKYSKNK